MDWTYLIYIIPRHNTISYKPYHLILYIQESAQHAAKPRNKWYLKGTDRTEKQKAADDSKKGVVPKPLESHFAKIHKAGRGRLGSKLLSLTELSVSMPPVDAPEQDLLDWAEKVSSVIIEFKLDGCNERGLRAALHGKSWVV